LSTASDSSRLCRLEQQEHVVSRLNVVASIAASVVMVAVSASSAVASTLRVPSQYPTIQAAVDAAVDGDLVLVSKGTYFGTVRIQGKTIELSSVSGPTETILDAANADTALLLAETYSHVHGFTVTHGAGFYGGGLLLGDVGKPLVEDMIITQNAAVFGGGVYFFHFHGVLHHNRIVDNHATYHGGGIFATASDGAIHDNLIENNIADMSGAGFYTEWGALTVLRNVIRANQGATWGGGIYASTGSHRFADNLVVDNHALFHGGGVTADFDNHWVNNTIADNTSDEEGSQVYLLDSATGLFANNAIIGQDANAVYCRQSATFDHNDVYPSAGGSCADSATTGTNLSEPPGFVEGSNGHPYHVAPGSPLVDAGSNEAARRLPRDLGKRPRIADGGLGLIVDIGAYEYQPK
jgi:hypothetical protein